MIRIVASSLIIILSGCAAQSPTVQNTDASARNADGLLVVDCLLPGQIRKLGRNLTYLTPQRPVKTTASDCEIRGGDYVSYDRSNYATALKVWLPKAKEGDPAAQTYVGEIYEKGLGIEADYAIAAHWYELAAQQGYSRAQINLGYLYESGLGVPRDLSVAMNWYRKASGLENGNLEYVSSVEIANRQAAQRESVELKQEVTQLRGELGQANEQLKQHKAQLEKAQQDALALKEKLQQRKQALASQSSLSVGQPKVTVDPLVQRDLELRLADTQKEQQRLIAKLAQQQLSAKQLSRELEGVQLQLDERQQQVQTSEHELQRTRTELEKAKLASASENVQEVQRLLTKENALQSKIKAQRDEMAGLETDMQTQATALNDELTSVKQKEETLQQTLRNRNQEVTSLQEQLNVANQQIAQQQMRDKELSALEADLRQREADIEKQKLAIAEIQSQVTKGAINSGASTAAILGATTTTVAVAETIGPTIEIIDPPLSVTRSKPMINLRSAISEAEIVGRVSPRKELFSFTVNDRKQTVADNGLFRIKVPVHAPTTPLSLVAVDNNGKRTAIDFIVVPKAEQTHLNASEAETKLSDKTFDVDFGDYYALIIGNNQYVHLSNLNTAINDAKAVDTVLREKYGFKTKLLLNADRYTMLSALNELRETLTEKDNLLIYYAGHGELDSQNQRGYWLPVDAEPDTNTNWISNVAITDILNVIPATHVMVVADSCYSGAMTRTSVARLQGGMPSEATAQWLKIMTQTKARTVLTSGGIQPVLDSAGGDHSIFTKAFIDVLQGNGAILEGFKLYTEVYKRVKEMAANLNVDQDPQYAPIKYAGHEAGEFFFLPRGASVGQVLSSQERTAPSVPPTKHGINTLAFNTIWRLY